MGSIENESLEIVPHKYIPARCPVNASARPLTNNRAT